ncbi:MAG: NADPH:quinone oxidoreductase [Phycisphaerae bacterium]|jgi:NADPH2:quinone reductase|nr:MAG: NADPH:quinone oxidoreductase [Phycisphaerae bacterium]
MKAWVLPQFGSIQSLKLVDYPDPIAGPGEVVLEMTLAGLNPADRYLAEGQYPARPTLPHILGRDGIGTVVQVGPGVHHWKVEDQAVLVRSEVGVNRPGTFAEKVAVPAESLVRPPEGWTIEQSAGATLVYLTAWQALTQWGKLDPSVVLVTGASGGVGVATLQLGHASGHTLIGMSRGSSKVKKIKDLGADLVVDPHDTQWRRRVREFLGNRKVDLVVDNIGGPVFGELIDTLGMWGKVSVVGRLAGPVPQFNTASLFFRRIRIGGVAVGTYTADESREVWQHVVQTLNRTGAKPVVDEIYPFDRLPEAFERLSQGPFGKVLLRVR